MKNKGLLSLCAFWFSLNILAVSSIGNKFEVDDYSDVIINPSFIGGEHVGNGGGLSESNFAFAKANLANVLSYCLKNKVCLSDIKEKDVVKKIYDGLRLNPINFKYVSEKENKGFFFLDDNVRVAKTGSHVRDIIYINRDMIYNNGESIIDINSAIAILVHELGHHYGVNNHNFLDLVGAKVALFWSKKKKLISSYHNNDFTDFGAAELVEVSKAVAGGTKEMLILETLNHSVNLSPIIERVIKESVDKSCSIKSTTCDMFLGFSLFDKYNVDLLYYSNVNITKDKSSEQNGFSYKLKVTIDVATHYDYEKRTSSFYDLKQKVHFSLTIDHLTDELKDYELVKLDPVNYFGLNI